MIGVGGKTTVRARSELLIGTARPSALEGRPGAAPAGGPAQGADPGARERFLRRIRPDRARRARWPRPAASRSDCSIATSPPRPRCSPRSTARRSSPRSRPSGWCSSRTARSRWRSDCSRSIATTIASVLTRKWLRLFLYASLAEVTMAPDYTQAIVHGDAGDHRRRGGARAGRQRAARPQDRARDRLGAARRGGALSRSAGTSTS